MRKARETAQSRHIFNGLCCSFGTQRVLRRGIRAYFGELRHAQKRERRGQWWEREGEKEKQEKKEKGEKEKEKEKEKDDESLLTAKEVFCRALDKVVMVVGQEGEFAKECFEITGTN